MAVVAVNLKERYRDTISISKDGLTFKDSEGSRLLKWENITNIFNWIDLDRLVVIDDDENVHRGNLPLHSSFRTYEEQIDYIWKHWADGIRSIEIMDSFNYPRWCLKQQNYLFLENALEGIVCAAIFFGLFAWILLREPPKISTEWIWPVCGAVAGFVSLLWGLFNLKKRIERKFEGLSIKDNVAQVGYSDGSIRSFNILNITEFKLKSPLHIGTVIFEDGTTLRDIERVSYWPILREYLLSKLEPLKKT